MFQSTHPHGVRRNGQTKQSQRLSFNPRTHMGCDFERLVTSRLTDSFNPRTHMGCDYCFFDSQRIIKSFNPRTHMGCDKKS